MINSIKNKKFSLMILIKTAEAISSIIVNQNIVEF